MWDKRSDVWEMRPNVYLTRLTVTLFHSLLSSEWFFLALSRRASGWKQTWWKSECFWAPWPWNDVPTVSISPSMDLEPQHHEVSQDTTNEAPERMQKKKKENKKLALFDTDIPVYRVYLSDSQPLGSTSVSQVIVWSLLVSYLFWALNQPWMFLPLSHVRVFRKHHSQKKLAAVTIREAVGEMTSWLLLFRRVQDSWSAGAS